MRPFKISEVDLESECRELRVEGELDLAVADQLRGRLDAAAEEGLAVILCLEQCDFIDSTGIATIVLAHRLMAESGRRLFVCGSSGQVDRILAVAGLNDAGLVYPSAEAAKAELFGSGAALPSGATSRASGARGSGAPSSDPG